MQQLSHRCYVCTLTASGDALVEAVHLLQGGYEWGNGCVQVGGCLLVPSSTLLFCIFLLKQVMLAPKCWCEA
jgi:hypothetical protein